MADLNEVIISGTVVTEPTLTKLNSSTPLLSFQLAVLENFVNKVGRENTKENVITVEVLGQKANECLISIKRDCRYLVKGYLRSDFFEDSSAPVIRVRAYIISPDKSNDSLIQKQVVKQAIEILKRSKDIPSAIQKLEQI